MSSSLSCEGSKCSQMLSMHNVLYTVNILQPGFFFYFIFSGRVLDKPRYIKFYRIMTWLRAQSFCRSRYTDLFTIRNETEMQILQTVARSFRVWIGHFRDSWIWSDKSTSSFRNWIPTQPMDDPDGHKCAGLTERERWEAFACEDKRPFLCHCEQSSWLFLVLCLLKRSHTV